MWCKIKNRINYILAVIILVMAAMFVSGCTSASWEESTVQKSVSRAAQSVKEHGESFLWRLLGMHREPALTETWNVLLIGSDRRDTSWNGNSDCMILLSVNPASSRVHMVSFMRDTQANIPGYGAKKLNSAYAIGGAGLLVQTIQSNFQVPIHNYVSVDFSGMKEIVDALGGVVIELNEAEAGYLQKAGYAVSAGATHMDGKLALAYSRIRYVGNADYERTLRQRRVLTEIFYKLKNESYFSMLSIVTKLSGYVTTDIPSNRLVWLTSNALNILKYELDSDRIPYDGLYSYCGENLLPDYAATSQRLQAYLAQ